MEEKHSMEEHSIDNSPQIRYLKYRNLSGEISMRKSAKNAVLILLFLTLTVSVAVLAYLHFFASDNLTGRWTTRLDMTEQAAATAFGWLQDIEAVPVSLEEMDSYMQDLTVQVNLTFEQTGRNQGTFQCNVLPESYEACRQAAYEAFAAAFRESVAERLKMAGYTGSTDEDAVEALVAESFGMSAVDYLMTCAPALLPSLEELQGRYDGSGTYETADGVLIRSFDTGGAAKAECYIRKDSTLILSGEADSATVSLSPERYPIIYTNDY